MERYVCSKDKIDLNNIKKISYIVEFDSKNIDLTTQVIQNSYFYKIDISKLNIFFIKNEKELDEFLKAKINFKESEYDGYERTFSLKKRLHFYPQGFIFKNLDKISVEKIDLSIKIEDNKVQYFFEKISLKDIKEEPRYQRDLGYYHFSDYPIYKKNLEEVEQFKNFKNIYPTGLWYAVNFDYYRDRLSYGLCKYCYKLDISELNIKKIKNIDELTEFQKKYNYRKCIDWNKMKQDYDGLQINKKILNFLKDKKKEDKKDKDKKDKKETDYSKYYWVLHWKEPVGVILSNYEKLKLERIKIKLIIVNGKSKFYL